MNRILLMLAILIGILCSQSFVYAVPALHDYAFQVNGSLYARSYPGGMDGSGFDTNTGLGRLVIQFPKGNPGNYTFRAFFDHEVEETTNGFDNENGGTGGGALGAGQSWEIGEPGYQTGNVYGHFLDGVLGNTNGVGGGMRDDTSMAMGWSFSLAAGESARVTLVLTQDAGQVPANLFYLMHEDGESGERVYFWGQLEKVGDEPPGPEPEVVVSVPVLTPIGMLGLLGGIGISALAMIRRRKKRD